MMYPGYCAKYGAGKMFSLGIVFGIAAGAGCEAIIHGAEYVWGGALLGYFGGTSGMIAGSAVHWVADDYCGKREMGLSKGGALTKKMQLAAYSTMLMGTIAAHQFDFFGPRHHMPQQPDQQTTIQDNRAPQALDDMLDTHGLRLAA